MRTYLLHGVSAAFALSLLSLLSPGCTPEIPEGVLSCTSDPQCPPDWVCRGNLCYSGTGADAGELDTGRTDGGAVRCERDVDCSNGVFCDGVERCMPDATGADPVTGCLPPDGPACLPTQACEEEDARCVTDCEIDPDADGDTHDAIECGGMDCDDANADVHPEHIETCDEIDNDCDATTFGDTDLDADGVVSDRCCNPTAEGTLCGADCDDEEPTVGSADAEVCDGLDNDCNGTTDDDLLVTFYADADGDMYGVDGMTMEACSSPSGYAERGGDCDDATFGVNPGATETCNGIDDDCMGGADGPECSCTNGTTQACGSDVGVCMAGTQTCVSGMWAACTGATEGMAEACNGLDDDCDTVIDGATASCSTRTNTSSTCSSPNCIYACTAPFQTCDSADPGDTTGCESNRNTDVAHCGGCTACATPSNVATRACVAATCTVLTCAPTFGNCNGTFDDGCERAINTVTDCGSCGNACPVAPGATPVCGSSGCSYVCTSGRSDCDGNITNGCETARASCDAPPPRLMAPLNAMVVTSNRPVIRFEGVAGVPSAQVQVCSDASCSTVVWSGIGTSPLTVGTSLPPGRYYWRARAVVGTTIGTAASAVWNFVTFATTTPPISTNAFPLLNVAGGRDDLVIGGPTTSGGRVVLFDGGGPTATQTLNAPASRAGFGSSVSSVDVNGDGYGDLIVGCCLASDVTVAPSAATGCSGAVVVYAGMASGTFNTAPIFNLVLGGGFGYSVAGIGDFNGDGYGDFAVGDYAAGRVSIFRGSASGVNATALTFMPGSSHRFGWSVASAGDTDGNFLDEVIVGQFSRAGGDFNSSATLLSLRTADNLVLSASISGTVPSRVTGLGDVNQDGRADYAVASTATTGSVVVFAGGGSQIWTVPGTASSGFGTSVIGVGDLDGDGRGDVAVGAPGTPEVFTYQGFTGSLIWSVTDSHAGFGYSLGRGGFQSLMPLSGALAIASCGFGTTCTAEVTLWDGDATSRSLRGTWSGTAGDSLFGFGLPR